jgi:hypothetical protein
MFSWLFDPENDVPLVDFTGLFFIRKLYMYIQQMVYI